VKLFAMLHQASPGLARDTYTLHQLVDELVVPTGALPLVKVHKRRVRYTVGGRTSEVTELRADGKATRTIAIESEDAAAVIAAVESVGLGGGLNVNYPRGLRSLLDDLPERYAVIDVGTNSVKFHVGERDAGGAWRTIVDRAELTQLGEGLDARSEIGSEAIERTATTIVAMVEEAKGNQSPPWVPPACASPATARRSAPQRAERARASPSR
jgi:exopolyphosphatase/guanosine-5'-triphosphate,3'-diphosphate pyrophosphatase